MENFGGGFVGVGWRLRGGERTARRVAVCCDGGWEGGEVARNRYHSSFSMFSWRKPSTVGTEKDAWRGSPFEWEWWTEVPGRDGTRTPRPRRKEASPDWNPYDVLGLQRGVEFAYVKQAYRALARELHPDLTVLPKHEATTRFLEICQAFEVIAECEGVTESAATRWTRRPPGPQQSLSVHDGVDFEVPQ